MADNIPVKRVTEQLQIANGQEADGPPPKVHGITCTKIGRGDLPSVCQCLSTISVHWYDIGFYLRVPKDKLDQIEKDHRQDVPRQLIEMVDGWINNCERCTWEELVDALKSRGYKDAARMAASQMEKSQKEKVSEQPKEMAKASVTNNKKAYILKELMTLLNSTGAEESARMVALTDSLNAIEHNERHKASPKIDWDHKENKLREEEVIYNLKLLKVKEEEEKLLKDLRKAFCIPDTSSNELMWCSIDEQIFQGSYNFKTFEHTLKDLASIEHIRLNILQTQAYWLSQEITEISSLLRRETVVKEVRETHESKPKAKSLPPSGETIQVECKILAQNDAILHRAGSYHDSICRALNNCLDNVNSDIRHCDNMSKVTSSHTRVYRSIMSTATLLTWALALAVACIIYGLLLQPPLSFSPTTVTTVSVFGLTAALEYITWLHSTCNDTRTLVTTALQGHRRLVCALSGATITAIFTALTYDGSVILVFHSWTYGTLIFNYILEYVNILSVGLAVLLLILIVDMPSLIVIIHIIEGLVLVTLLYAAGVIGALIGATVGHWAVIAGAATGGAVAALCVLRLATAFTLPCYQIEIRMGSGTYNLNKATLKLKYMREKISRVINDYQQLPQKLHLNA